MASEHSAQKAFLAFAGVHPSLRLFRNNRGAMVRESAGGSKRGFVRYGLGEGASDVIGFRKCEVADEYVARFVAIEFKPPGWKFPARPPKPGASKATWKAYMRLVMQREFIEDVTAAGGLAGFARSLDEAREIVGV